eukprot:10033728-Alexandrium_andersonii.AAC.1
MYGFTGAQDKLQLKGRTVALCQAIFEEWDACGAMPKCILGDLNCTPDLIQPIHQRLCSGQIVDAAAQQHWTG